ncbi:MAG: phosphopantothenoylcysteine synthase [Methylacidiphilales bacterium]|nr:phosphopantothenoylcysteine synthase [Candidatus Methylacidiphilales bacterium]
MGDSSRIVLGVTGSIAAYRAAELASTLTKEGVAVDAVLTDEALRFITPLTFAALTRREVFTRENDGMFKGQPTHIAIGDRADLVVVAPATAHLIAQVAHGLAPDLLTSLLLATPAPVLIAPAMNGKMWNHPATQDNVNLLRKRGVNFIGPEAGLLACGYEGIGRLWPVPEIAREIFSRLKR